MPTARISALRTSMPPRSPRKTPIVEDEPMQVAGVAENDNDECDSEEESLIQVRR
jgi:hypothetical protein